MPFTQDTGSELLKKILMMIAAAYTGGAGAAGLAAGAEAGAGAGAAGAASLAAPAAAGTAAAATETGSTLGSNVLKGLLAQGLGGKATMQGGPNAGPYTPRVELPQSPYTFDSNEYLKRLLSLYQG